MRTPRLLAAALAATLAGCWSSFPIDPAADAGPGCGDGIVQTGERCDDGGSEGGTCSADCQVILAAPCAGPYVRLTSPDRHVDAPTGGPPRCDRLEPVSTTTGTIEPAPDDWEGHRWYRFDGAAGTGMPFAAPPQFRCGGDATGWTTEPPPRLDEGVVERTACFHYLVDPCLWRTTVRVVHCDEFLLYELAEAPMCHLRHCGADVDPADWR